MLPAPLCTASPSHSLFCVYRGSQGQLIEDEQVMSTGSPWPNLAPALAPAARAAHPAAAAGGDGLPAGWPEGRQHRHPQNHPASLNPLTPPRTTSGRAGGVSHHGSGCLSWNTCLPTHYCLDSCRAGRALLSSASPLPLSLFFSLFYICVDLLSHILLFPLLTCYLFSTSCNVAMVKSLPWNAQIHSCKWQIEKIFGFSNYPWIIFIIFTVSRQHEVLGRHKQVLALHFSIRVLEYFEIQPLSTQRPLQKKHISHTLGTRTKHTVLQFTESLHGLGWERF